MHDRKYKIVYYYENGKFPIVDFIANELTEDQRGAVKRYAELLEEKGPDLKRPQVDKLKNYKKLWELRPSFWKAEIRIIFTWHNGKPVFLEGFIKKSDNKKTDRHYKRAEERRIKLEKSH